MKLADLAHKLEISPESIKQFIQDFDLNLDDCITTNFDVKQDLENFAEENKDFLKKYDKDLIEDKTIDQIADKINQPKDKVEKYFNENYPNIFDNGLFKSSVSSYWVDNDLGGNYKFVYDYFGQKTSLQQRDFIGYRDLFFYITENLEPFLDEKQKHDWGIHKPAGIILYGPPGSGKIFWANKISEIIHYTFKEVKKYYLGTSFVDGNKVDFNDFLVTMMNEDKVLLFIEDFDEIMLARNPSENVASCNEATKDVIMHYIGKFSEEGILMVGSAETISDMDEEVLAPGRFDTQIPIFPPNSKERAEIILYSLTKNLDENAILTTILKNNGADKIPFWYEVADKMKVFSNTMVIDFTQSIKKRIKHIYQRSQNNHLKIDENLLKRALRDASSKLTEEYLNQVAQFIADVSINNYEYFAQRLKALNDELQSYKAVEVPQRAIGFQHNVEEKIEITEENTKADEKERSKDEPVDDQLKS